MTFKGQTQGHQDFEALSRKGGLVRATLVLNINRKPYMESLMGRSHSILTDLQRSKSRSLKFQSLISRIGA